MRAITNSDNRAHSTPLFAKLGIFQVNSLQIAKFMFYYHNRLLPPMFLNLFSTSSQAHGYTETRTASFYRPYHCRTSLKQLTILYQSPKIWNSLPISITGITSFPTFTKKKIEFLMKATLSWSSRTFTAQ